jgi:integrase/recombinase XerD
MQIHISKITHHDAQRLVVSIPYNNHYIQQIKQIPGATFSRTLNSWHIPFTKRAYTQLTSLFPSDEFIKTDSVQPDDHHPALISSPNSEQPQMTPSQPHHESPAPAFFPTPTTRNAITLEVAARRLILRMPKNDTDVQFVLTFRYALWNPGIYAWIIPHYRSNLEIIINYFGSRLTSVIQQPTYDFTDNSGTRTIIKDTMLVIKTRNNRLHVIFSYNENVTKFMKTIPYTRWDSKNKWWSTPYSESIKLQIKTEASIQNLDFQYEEEVKDETKAVRITPYDIPNYRTCPDSFIEKLQEMRYSPHTIQTYSSLFEEFINYYHRFDISRIDEHQIIAFLRHLVTERKVSISYQNQSINAIKFYYERVLGREYSEKCVSPNSLRQI